MRPVVTIIAAVKLSPRVAQHLTPSKQARQSSSNERHALAYTPSIAFRHLAWSKDVVNQCLEFVWPWTSSQTLQQQHTLNRLASRSGRQNSRSVSLDLKNRYSYSTKSVWSCQVRWMVSSRRNLKISLKQRQRSANMEAFAEDKRRTVTSIGTKSDLLVELR